MAPIPRLPLEMNPDVYGCRSSVISVAYLPTLVGGRLLRAKYVILDTDGPYGFPIQFFLLQPSEFERFRIVI